MSSDEFVHVSAGPIVSGGGPSPWHSVSQDYFNNSKGDRQYTAGYMVASIRQKHPNYHLTLAPGESTKLLSFADSRDDATYITRIDGKDTMIERSFIPPARSYSDERGGSFIDKIIFSSYDYTFKGNQFILYIVAGNDDFYLRSNNYLLIEEPKEGNLASAQQKVDELLAEAAKWSQDLPGEVYVFDQGLWQKNKDLWQNIQESNWEDVILEKEKKVAIIEDVVGFFDSESRYAEFGVPWKVSVYRPNKMLKC
jgi:transitional endoplasmic reticulum ATPase